MKKRMRRRGYENSENGQQKKISGKNDRLKRENKKRPTKAARKRPITIQQEWQTKTARSFNRNNEKLPRRPTKQRELPRWLTISFQRPTKIARSFKKTSRMWPTKKRQALKMAAVENSKNNHSEYKSNNEKNN